MAPAAIIKGLEFLLGGGPARLLALGAAAKRGCCGPPGNALMRGWPSIEANEFKAAVLVAGDGPVAAAVVFVVRAGLALFGVDVLKSEVPAEAAEATLLIVTIGLGALS